jgi:hypothetical protein
VGSIMRLRNMRATAFVDGLDPAVRPLGAEAGVEAGSQDFEVWCQGNVVQRYARFDQDRPGGHLAMNVQEQVFGGDGLRRTVLVSGNVTADELDEIVQQQAEGELEDGCLRSAADQALQMEDFRDLLEHLFDEPSILPSKIEIGRSPVHRELGFRGRVVFGRFGSGLGRFSFARRPLFSHVRGKFCKARNRVTSSASAHKIQ